MHDLVISKYAALREKDIAFVQAAIRHGLADRRQLIELLAGTALLPECRNLIACLIARNFAALRPVEEPHGRATR